MQLAWVALGVVTPLVAAAVPKGADVSADAAAMQPWLTETRRWFHAHPELSNREVETSRSIAQRLTAMGYEPQTGIAGHGVVALLNGGLPGPLVAYRADMDALPITEMRDVPYKSRNPGVMHACGHDLHTTVGLGVAQLLMKHRDQLHGSVKFIFQPAEEGPPPGEEGGAALMVKQNVLVPAPVAVFGLHVWPSLHVGDVGYQSGPLMAAASRFNLTIKGKQAHGAQPHEGVDAVFVASQVVTGMQGLVSRQQDARKPLVITIGSFHAGSRFNIVAGEAVLEGTVRTLDPDTYARIQADIERVVGGITAAYGASYSLDYHPLAPPVVNDPALTTRSLPVLGKVLGTDHVRQVQPVMVSEDFGVFTQHVPSLFLFLGVGHPQKGITGNIHTAEFQADEAALVVGVKAMAALIMARTSER